MAAASRQKYRSKSPVSPSGPTRADLQTGSDPAQDPAQDDLPPAGSIDLDSLEVVEHMQPGSGFTSRKRDDTDSFAMEDPPSDEVRLDPRFNRVSDAATQLI